MSSRTLAGRVLRSTGWTLAAAALFLGVATLRAVMDGESEIAKSDAAFDANDLHAAIQHARRAASAYAPGAPHVEQGYRRLRAIARGAEGTGRPDLALLAWQAERAAVLESAAFWQPFPSKLDEANRNLARLTASKTLAESGRGEVAQRLFKQAQLESVERAPWGALLAAGLLIAGGGLAWFAARGLGHDGRIAWRRGWGGGAVFALGAALWALAALRG